jgi:hypothetical protein
MAGDGTTTATFLATVLVSSAVGAEILKENAKNDKKKITIRFV